jgi:c-di-GMP-binding flagellar brake protein YcgR
MESKKNRRKFDRAIFSLEDKITAVVSIQGHQGKTITVYILNLGLGGMQFTPNSDDLQLQKGDRLVLMQIKTSMNTQFLLNIDAEVRWILNPPMLEHIGIGCAFINIPESSLEQITQVVDNWSK